jgi:hypothetical protein
MYDIPFDRSFLQLSNGITYVMPSTDTKPELTAKASVAQPVSQPAVYANGLMHFKRLWQKYGIKTWSAILDYLWFSSVPPDKCRNSNSD